MNGNCPICDHRFRMPDSAIGKKGTCKSCGARFTLADPSKQVAKAAVSSEVIEALRDLETAEREADAIAVESTVELYTSDSVTRPGFRIERTYPVVTARRVEGVNILKDIAMWFRDGFGGRSKTAEDMLESMEAGVLREIQYKARRLGANAAIGLRVQHGEISGGAKAQMFYVAGQATPVALVEIEE